MSAFYVATHISVTANLNTSRITALEIGTQGDSPVLYASTRYDGQITAWSIDSTGMTQTGLYSHQRQDGAGAVVSLDMIETSHGTGLVTGGGVQGQMRVVTLTGEGGFGGVQSPGLIAGLGGDLIHTATVQLANGDQAIYGGLLGQSGIGRITFDAAGIYKGAQIFADTMTAFADRVTALASAAIEGNRYLYSASTTEAGLTSWGIGPDGTLTEAQSIGAEHGLWIDAPTALEVVSVAGKTYLVLAAAGTGSLSVVELGADGGMRVTDHVLDDLNTRFAGVVAMTSVEHDGQSYIIAGGSDDGITLLQVLPGGKLITRAVMEDQLDISLAKISAITAVSDVGGSGVIDIFVASSIEDGITRLRFDPGTPGQTLLAGETEDTLTGGPGNDVLVGGELDATLIGGAGDDIIMDGPGRDIMTGGPGADIFILMHDDMPDTITDFTLGEDMIDLSSWPFLRDIRQLHMTTTETGIDISFGDETLHIHSADGAPITRMQLGNRDLINITRLPPAFYEEDEEGLPTLPFVPPPEPQPPIPPPDLSRYPGGYMTAKDNPDLAALLDYARVDADSALWTAAAYDMF